MMVQMDEERRRQIEEEAPPLTRAEWIKYARAECEKQLPVFEDPVVKEQNQEEEEPLHAVYVPIGDEEEVSYDVQEEETVEEEEEEEEEIYKNPILHAMQYDDAIPINEIEKIKWSYMTKLGVRVFAAVIIAVFAISLDYFGVKTEYINSDKIKDAITRNDTIEQIEESVSAFAKDTILPLISGADKQEKTASDSGQIKEQK